MKKHILVIGVLALALSPSWAKAHFEDDIPLDNGTTLEKKEGAVTARIFELQNFQGQYSTLESRNGALMLKPASTMKLFTAWMSLQRGSRTDAYLSEMLRMSDNAKAESTIANLGGAGVLLGFLRGEGLSISTAHFTAVDGSGLSKSNRTNCLVEMQLLRHIKDSPDYERFANMLAKPGEEGTLDKRLLSRRGQIFAKTGTLKATSALTGYALTTKGTLLFCIISDGFSNTWDAERARIDRMLMAKINEIEAP